MIVITTPTGQIGRQVLGNLLESGEELRVIARDPSQLPAGVREDLDIVESSHGDAAVVDKAFAGADAVLWLSPADRRAPSVEAAFAGFTRPAAEAFNRHGVGRVVGVSVLEAWIAPPAVRELRELTRYRQKLVSLRTSCKDQVHAVLAKLGVPVTCTDIFGVAGSAWLDELGLPQPYAGKVTSLRQLTADLTTEITMLSEVTATLLRADRGYQVIQQLPGIGPVLAAVIIAEIGDVHRFKTAAQLCSWAGLTPRHRESDTKVTRGQAGLAAPAVGADRGDPAAPAGVGNRLGQSWHRRPPRQGGPQHRQGRRRPPAAHPGLLRPARRADPLPVHACRPAGHPAAAAGGMTSSPGQRPGARPPMCLPRRLGGAGAPLIDPA